MRSFKELSYMLNNSDMDEYTVFIVAKTNNVASWTCRTKEDAEATADSYLLENPQFSKARVTRRTKVKGKKLWKHDLLFTILNSMYDDTPEDK